MSDIVEAVIDLGRLALAFGRIDRTACYHPDGITKESGTDHTVMLGWIAPALAERFFPRLDAGPVAQFALVHDAVEVFAGDTPTLRISGQGRAGKAAREHAAAGEWDLRFDDRLPWMPQMIRRYEAQLEAEARFARGVDKILPKIVHLLDGAAGLRDYGMGSGELAEVFARQASEMAGYVGEFTELMDLRAELVDRVTNLLAQLPAAAGGTPWRFGRAASHHLAERPR